MLTLSVTGRAGLPSTSATVVLNVTAVNATAAGYATVYPWAADTECVEPELRDRATIANTVITTTGTGGPACLYTSASVHLIVDVSGYIPRT